jgi:predicted nucleic acid-binding protein
LRVLRDTTFLIDAERSGDSLDEWLDDDDEAAMAAITVSELRVGVLLRTGETRAARLAFLEDAMEIIPVVEYGGRWLRPTPSSLLTCGVRGGAEAHTTS